ncbi:MAG TPA: sigma factor-like helix-turn-helix DNA-binding protein [Steroidobacteraceae bacterium]|jgi:predicted RNA polymerase sigma factor|nr:sigma factor-like helix-turn-helix DNA-binding protein [Steroidobacteraceae bacterium]
MCCHPTLTPASAIALTLRAVGGLTTAEIANTFLVPEATMAQRISRAKQRIKDSGVPFEMPAVRERTDRSGSVLHVLHGPGAGLQLLATLDADERLAGHYRLAAVRAHLYEMIGDHTVAISQYRAAADRTTSIPERNYLIAQAARLSTDQH